MLLVLGVAGYMGASLSSLDLINCCGCDDGMAALEDDVGGGGI